MADEKLHAEFSASGSARWLACPGSIALSKDAPPQRESEYALEGTQAHVCLEQILTCGQDPDAQEAWPPEMFGHAYLAAEWIRRYKHELPGSELLVETKVDASHFTCEGQFGTLDAAVVQEFGRLVVIDYKYGAGVAVYPCSDDGEANSQLVYYALGVASLYDYNFADVELVIIQPRAWTESGETVRSHVMTIEELMAWIPRFRDGVNATKRKDAPLASGSHCKWCPAATICPEIKNKAFKQAQIVFSDSKGITAIPMPTQIQLPHLGTILDACEKLEDWIQKVREHAVHVLERGEDVEGFKLVAKKSPRRWLDIDLRLEARKQFGAKAFTEPTLLSPAQLEKAAKGTEGLDAWITARTTNESSGTTLVRESDKRPAIRPVEEAFRPIKSLPQVVSVIPSRIDRKRSRKR